MAIKNRNKNIKNNQHTMFTWFSNVFMSTRDLQGNLIDEQVSYNFLMYNSNHTQKTFPN